jgi:DNA-binding MarR family transcriptional regulator
MSAQWTKAGCSDWFEMWAPKLKPHGIFKVAFIISRHADDESGECEISIKTLAEMCGMSPSDVHKAVKRLPEIGCIHVEPGKQGAGHCAVYRLLAEEGEIEAHKENLKARRKARREEYARRKAQDGKSGYRNQQPEKRGNGAHMPDAAVVADDEIDARYQRIYEWEQRNFEASRITMGSS